MSAAPPFLAALGVAEADAASVDERGLRRAYAKRLKAIDVEADPQAFQALRESLEAALGWVGWRDRQAAAASTGTPAAADAQPAPAAPARPAFEAIAEAAFAAFAEQAERGFASEQAAAAAIGQALADERLLNLDARTFFEWRVGCLLANGWRPGHEFLLDPAAGAFDWESDPTRLGVFGPLGGLLGAALRERAAFRRQPAPAHDAQAAMLARLRSGAPPVPAELWREMPLLQALVERFPNWLAMVTPRAAVNERIEMWNRIPPDRRRQPPRAAAPAAREGGVGWLVWVVLAAFGAIGKIASLHEAPAPPARPAGDGAYDRLIDADIERRQAQAQALLERLAGEAAPPAAAPPRPASAAAPRPAARPAPGPRYDASFGALPGATFESGGSPTPSGTR